MKLKPKFLAVTFLLATISCVPAVHAQDDVDDFAERGHPGSLNKAGIQLSRDQLRLIQEYRAAYHARIRAIRGNPNLNRRQKKQESDDADDLVRSQVRRVLTTDQQRMLDVFVGNPVGEQPQPFSPTTPAPTLPSASTPPPLSPLTNLGSRQVPLSRDLPQFDQLAALLSDRYSSGGTYLDQPYREGLWIDGRVWRGLKFSNDPNISTATQIYLAKSEELQARESIANFQTNFGENLITNTAQMALNGDFRGTEINQITGERAEVNRGFEAMGVSMFIGGLFMWQGMMAKNEIYKSFNQTEILRRVAAWAALMQGLPRYYPQAQVKENLVSLSLAEGDPTRTRRGKFIATNTSGQRPTRVLFLLDLVQYGYAPSPSSRRLYYVPSWEPNETLRFSTQVLENLSVGDKPVPLRPYVASGPPEQLWPNEAGSLVDANVRVWSDQYVQKEKVIRFEAVANRIAFLELRRNFTDMVFDMRRPPGVVSQQVDRFKTEPFVPDRVPSSSNSTPNRFQQRLQETVERNLSRMDRIVTFSSPNTDTNRWARTFKADPQGAVIDWCQKQLADVNEAIRQEVTFSTSLEGAGTNATRSQLFLTVRPSDAEGHNVTAKVWTSDKPTDFIDFVGNIQLDKRSCQAVINLSARLAPALPPGAPSRLSDPGTWKEFSLKPESEGLALELNQSWIYFSRKNEKAILPGTNGLFFIQRQTGETPGSRPYPLDQLVWTGPDGNSKVIREGKYASMRAVTTLPTGGALLYEFSSSPLSLRTPRSTVPNEFQNAIIPPRFVILDSTGSVKSTTDLAPVIEKNLGSNVVGAPQLLPGGRQIGFTYTKPLTIPDRVPRYLTEPMQLANPGTSLPVRKPTILSDVPMIAVVGIDGTGFREIGPGATPKWSADGSKILYSAITIEDLGNGPTMDIRWNRSQVAIMDADGRNPKPLLEEGTFNPAFGPDEKSLAFVNTPDIKSDTVVSVSDLQGRNRKIVAEMADSSCTTPFWVAHEVAFTRTSLRQNSTNGGEKEHCLWLTGLNEDKLHRITYQSGFGTVASVDFDLEALSPWLGSRHTAIMTYADPSAVQVPPGQKIVFEGSKAFFRDIYGNLTPIPDGNYILYTNFVVKIRRGTVVGSSDFPE